MNILRLKSPFPSGLPVQARSDADIAEYGVDESRLSGYVPASVAFPTSGDEVSAELLARAKNGQRTTIVGGRTGVVGGIVPQEDSELALSTEKLKNCEPIKIKSGKPTITAEAGVTLDQLALAIREQRRGLYFPVDPTEGSATIGGVIATNAGGARSFAYGSIRRWVQGIDVVLADGSQLSLKRGDCVVDESGVIVLETESGTTELKITAIPKPATKNSIGYSASPGSDIVDLFIGAEGTLGVVTAATLELTTEPSEVLFVLQPFLDVNGALEAVRTIRDRRTGDDYKVLSIEFFDDRGLAFARASGSSSIGDQIQGVAALFIELSLSSREGTEQFVHILETLSQRAGDALVAQSSAEKQSLKAFRHAVPEGANRIIAERKRTVDEKLHKIATDMAVPDKYLEDAFVLYTNTLTAAGFEFTVFGHAGDNHFHVNILPRDMAELRKAKELYLEMARQVVAWGGAVAAEHGIGVIKKPFLAVQYDAETLACMREIKHFFDPQWLLNPGVLLERA